MKKKNNTIKAIYLIKDSFPDKEKLANAEESLREAGHTDIRQVTKEYLYKNGKPRSYATAGYSAELDYDINFLTL